MSLKTITATVGQGAANIPSDVATIQYLLNCVPVSHGGPVRELSIDGFAGVVTTEAINRFQTLHFGSSDSRVGMGSQTLNELKKYDPLPYSARAIVPDSRGVKGGEISAEQFIKRSLDGGAVSGGDILKRSLDGGGIKSIYIKRPLGRGGIYEGTPDIEDSL
jgi:hypothetical protein